MQGTVFPFFTACPPGMQLNAEENINNNEQRCIPCPGGSISDGTVSNGGCTECSSEDFPTDFPYANVEQTACILDCRANDMPSDGKQCSACPDGYGVICKWHIIK